MDTLIYFLVGCSIVVAVGTFFEVGKPRKPITWGIYVFSLILSVIYVYLLLTLGKIN